MRKLTFILIILMLVGQAVFAQNESSQNKDPKYIIDPETGKLSMVIRVWGEVKQPGVSMVPSDADLISLLSYVGGPTDRAKLNKIRIIRFNENSNEERIVYANIEAFLETGDDSFIPRIYPNDTIIVQGNFWKVFSGFMPYVTTAITLLQFYYYIQLAQRT
ncbi:MAG: SLBB domain-containing protein [Candidatus Marinimicrobia bacterium]|nr:SLBB domain-containing protein [Candidatus Neomarinimicrobiota bacterium]MCF7851213.1 SLBB domain-containing protein [Candidatus Neomarinimicrobiota bacterium]MCF7905214.1 SLBB domain-containing protein [Candidatus Neomarinimicrobiota bacterium]